MMKSFEDAGKDKGNGMGDISTMDMDEEVAACGCPGY